MTTEEKTEMILKYNTMSTLNVMGKNVHIKKETGGGNAYGLCWCFTVKPLIRKGTKELGPQPGAPGGSAADERKDSSLMDELQKCSFMEFVLYH